MRKPFRSVWRIEIGRRTKDFSEGALMYLGFELEGFKSLDTVTRQEVDNYKANSGKLNISKLTNAIVA